MNKNFELEAEIYGRVQGIGLRAMIKNYADSNKLPGWVLNTKDGTVMVLIQGTKEKLGGFLEWIKTNPGFSRVNDIKFDIKKIKNHFKAFEIKTEYGFLEDKSRSFIKLGKSIFK